MPKNITARTLSIASRIVKFIADNPNTHIRAIARELNLHPQVVKRCIDRMSDFLEFTSFKNFHAPVANLPILIKLRDGCSVEGILNYLKSGGKKLPRGKIASVMGKSISSSIQDTSNSSLKGIDKKTQILRIAKFLEKNPNSYLREISRALNLNPAVVHRCLKEIGDFIVTRCIANGIGSIDLPNLPVMVRLKEGVTASGILRFLEVKKKINRFRR